MIEIRSQNGGTRLLLMQNRSLSWRGNLWVIFALALLCLGIAIGLTLVLGAWVILPFAGIEIALFATALYFVSRKLSSRELITLSKSHLTIEKGIYRPRQKWCFDVHTVNIAIEAPEHEWEAKRLFLLCGPDAHSANDKLQSSDEPCTKKIPIGEFLSQDEVEQLINYLSPFLSRRPPTS